MSRLDVDLLLLVLSIIAAVTTFVLTGSRSSSERNGFKRLARLAAGAVVCVFGALLFIDVSRLQEL